MHKTLLPAMLFGLLISACVDVSPPPSTPIPSTSSALAPVLLNEVDLETSTGTAYTLAWSPDGEILAVASGAEITLLSSDLRETRAVLTPERGALGVTWSADAGQLATVNGFRSPTIRIWDWARVTNELLQARELQAGSDQYSTAWSPDGKWLAALSGDKNAVIQIWDTATWEQVQDFELPYTDPRRGLRWSADSATLYGAGKDGDQVHVFALDVADGEVSTLARFSRAEAFALSPDGDRLAAAEPDGLVWILDLAAGTRLTKFESVDQPVDLAWNPRGHTLAVLAYKTQLQLWGVTP